MNHGKVEQVGTPEAVYNHPATPFVYSFLGSVNQFHGRVESGHLHFGDDMVPHAHDDAAHGSEVYAFVRPHELGIITEPGAAIGIAARVDRILQFGNSARVELDGVNGSTGQHFEVLLSSDEARTLDLRSGQRVRLQLSRLKVFQRDGIAEGRRAT